MTSRTLSGSLTDSERDRIKPNHASTSRDLASRESGPPPFPDNGIAVVGMACKFAGAESLDQFWEILQTGRSQFRDLPKDRFPDERFTKRLYSRNFQANMIDDVDAFDHKFFKIASREATFMDPQQRLALQVVYQALESSGYFSRRATERELDMGCFVGACTNEYHENVACHPPSAFSLTGSIRPFIAGKVSHHFGWTGPAMMLDTACAASGTAIHQACRAVAIGECQSAVAGGVSVFVSPDTFQDLAAGRFTSISGGSKSFDAAADGYCRGEGVAFVVLKKVSAALRDGDPILGVIASTVVGQNANETSITVPHGPSQMSLYRKALRLAGLDARDISYVEAHGTGTPKGDPIEVASIRGVFGDSAEYTARGRTYMGSLKSNIGHTEATSGVSELIKVLLMMQKQVIPQQALFKNLNPAIAALEPDNIEIPRSNIPWTSEFKAACVNNYGASGANAVMIVTQPPNTTTSADRKPMTSYPVSISAFSPSSLTSYCSDLVDFINRPNQNISLIHVSHQLSRRQNLDLPFSVSGAVSSLRELEALLKSTTAAQPLVRTKADRPVVMFFGGQAGRAANVSRILYDSCTIFRQHLNDCDVALQAFGVPSIFPTIFESEPQDDIVLLHSMLFSGQYASAMSWLDCGVRPARLLGHSFGQFTAMCVSGTLSLDDSLRLVVERARLIAEMWNKDSGAMIAIEADLKTVTSLIAQHADLNLEIACHNGPRNFVVAGATASIDALEGALKSSRQTFAYKRLQVTHAFHSALAEPLINSLQRVTESLEFRRAKMSLELCCRDAGTGLVTPTLIASHIREPVYFREAVDRISRQLGACTWLEAGPMATGAAVLGQAVGKGISLHEVKSVKLDSTSSVERLAQLTSELWSSGYEVQFWPFHQSQRYQYELLNLPPYHFDKFRHWLGWKDVASPATEAQCLKPARIPLLQLTQKTRDGGTFQIDTRCENWLDICSGYQVRGDLICPLSSLLDLVCKAINIIHKPETHDINSYNLRQLAVPKLLSTETDTRLHLTVASVHDLQSWRFEVSDALYTYTSGIVSAADQSTAGEFSRFQRLIDITRIRNLSNDDEADSVKAKAVYRSVKDLFQFPSTQRVVREVTNKGKEAVAYLMSLPNTWSAIIESLLQIPLLCLNGLRDHQNDEIYVVTALGQAKFDDNAILSSDVRRSWAAYVNFFGSSDLETTCDIFMFEVQSQRVSAVMLDVVLSPVQSRSPDRPSDHVAPHSQTSTNRCSSSSKDSDSTECEVLPSSDSESELELSPKRTSTDSPTLPDVTEALFDLFSRVADVEPHVLHLDALMADLGIDSLMSMEITEEVNKVFAVKINVAEAATAMSVRCWCELIASKTNDFSYVSETDPRIPPDDLVMVQPRTEASTPARPDLEILGDTKGSETINRAPRRQPLREETADNVFEAFDAIRGDFDMIAKETGCHEFWSKTYPAQADLVVSYVVEAFAKLGYDLRPMKEGDQIPQILPSSTKHMLINRLMRALRDDKLVNYEDDRWVRTKKPVSFSPSSSEKYERILAKFPQFAPDHKLLHVVGSNLAECLTGQVDPLTLLFGSPEKRKLMADQYSIAPIQAASSRQLCSFIKKCFSSRTARRPVRILEIGGGTCGTSLYTVEAFAQLDCSVEYTFSDISPSFVSAAKSKLAQYNFINYRTLDITKDAEPDMKDYYDMIIATNVIHATPDVCQSVGNARQMLRSGGFLTLIEYTRHLYSLDLVFGQLDGWWLFEDGRDHAIMGVDQWKTTLLRAGYERVDWTQGQSRESEILRIILAS